MTSALPPFPCSQQAGAIIPGMVQPGKITIVPTPIGNLGDITLRAVDALRASDAVLCEDTRVTGKLLAHLGVEKPLVRLDENTIRQRTDAILSRLHAGEALAYCSDAGMPGVSDPGMHLVAAARQAGILVEVLPGASAATTAYVASGFESTSFFFGGFLPKKGAERLRLLESLCPLDAALIFYESPHRLPEALNAVAQAFPHRRAAVCRELTKLHEEVASAPAPELARIFVERAAVAPIKGEVALVVEGPTLEERAAVQEGAAQDARVCAVQLIAEGMRPKEAAKELAARFGIPRNAAYELALSARNGHPGP